VSESLTVVAPLWLEARAVRRALPGTEVVRCGMGARKAESCARALAQRKPLPRAFAVAGVCGALDARLVPGDVVVASELRGGAKPIALESAKPLARALEARGFTVHVGPLLSLDHLLRRSERAAHAVTGALAVDMESLWLATLAETRPFAVLRVVSDGPGHELFSPSIVSNGMRALRALRAAAPALAHWANSPEEN
jgi:4-hydroxy-3-methylbut-2-enyl diphosphate reductase